MSAPEQEIEALMVRRAMDVDPWTYGEMCGLVRHVPHDFDRWWHADVVNKIHQRWRRKGWATFVRLGRNPFWSLTAEGRSALEASRCS